MLAATGGVNTHRGAIFGLGLLCAAAGAIAEVSIEGAAFAPMRLGDIVRRRWAAEIGRGPIPLFSHGAGALRRYGAGGVRAEAVGGFRGVYEAGWPALRQGRFMQPDDPAAAPVQACFALIASVCDTNLLHRGGAEGIGSPPRRPPRSCRRAGFALQTGARVPLPCMPPSSPGA